MPIYEYRCDKCQHEFEREQRISDDPVKTCPECRSRKVQRLISQTSFVLKGGGWYSDLYSSSGKKSSGSDSSDDAGGGTKSSKSDSKADSSKGKSKGKSKDKGGKKSAA